jgi:hypothetical protein
MKLSVLAIGQADREGSDMTRNKKIDRARDSEGIKKQTVAQYIDGTLGDIERIGGHPDNRQLPLKIYSHLHLIVLSGYYNYKDLKEKLGRLKVDKEFVPGERQPNYTAKAIRNFKYGISVDCFYNPIDPFFPFCLVEIHQRNSPPKGILKEFLMKLYKDFPGLKVSGVEYGNDIHCTDSGAVEELQWLLTRHLYIPYQRSIGDSEKKGNKNKKIRSGKNYGRKNRVLRMGDYFKMYERGRDPNKWDDHWVIEDCDRVRLEHTADRRKLLNHGIDTIGDLAKNPKFFDLNKGVYHFVNFAGSDKLPSMYDDYNSDPTNLDCFQAEHICRRSKTKNIKQYVRDTPEFAELLSALHNSWINYDKKWQDILYVKSIYNIKEEKIENDLIHFRKYRKKYNPR